MDINMPGVNGVEATRRIITARPDTGVLVLTMFDDDDSVFAAMRAGARGYVLKDADEEELTGAIRAVARGEAIFSQAVAGRVLAFFAQPRAAPKVFPTLTDREREILALIAQGRANPAIARTLFLSTKTVANYVSAIFAKLQVADRAEAMIRAREAGLGS
jgi:DNA-binding NarL/FixJ family response regulator